MVRLRDVAVAAVVAGVGGCKFSEKVTAPPSDPFLVVHGVLNTRETRQFVTVEKSTEGATAGISGARVDLTHLNPGSCSTPTVRLNELATPQPGVPMTGVYLTNSLCPLHPGDRMALRVETPDGHVVTGTTRIPGVSSLALKVGTTEFGFPPAVVPVDRTRDSIKVTMNGEFTRAMQIEAVRDDRGGFVTYRLSVDTTGIAIAGNLVDPFDGDGRTVFRAGAYYLFTVAAMDTNYFDFVRSGSDPFTGRGFINHLTGAVGVFGSVASYVYDLKVTAPQTDPREGMYRLTGRLSGVNVSVLWDLYRDVLTTKGNGFSGFVDGQWIDGPISTSANALLDVGPDGSSLTNAFAGQIYGPTTSSLFPGQVGESYDLSGIRAARGTAFPLQVIYQRNGRTVTDTLSAVQISGP